jgi:D-sedoheptulose 7-phosphate isomerase
MNYDKFKQAVNEVSEEKIQKFNNILLNYQNIILIGNGGSNAIASHISQDYTKKLKKRAFSFSDPSRLTCYINDYGNENAYAQFLKEFSDSTTLVILISSSGESKNIINCAEYCVKNKINFIILTGFNESNYLRENYKNLSLLDFWVNSSDYGIVECVHQTFLHTTC